LAESPTRITTWPQVVTHLCNAYPGSRSGGDVVALRVPLDVAGPAAGDFWHGASLDAATANLGPQPVEVSRIDVSGLPWIRITSVIGSARYASPVEMLGNNLHSPIGAFCLEDGSLALRQTLPLVGLRLVDLDEAVRGVAHQAAWARKHLSDGSSGPRRRWLSD
jgi:hypothetical protein